METASCKSSDGSALYERVEDVECDINGEVAIKNLITSYRLEEMHEVDLPMVFVKGLKILGAVKMRFVMALLLYVTEPVLLVLEKEHQPSRHHATNRVVLFERTAEDYRHFRAVFALAYANLEIHISSSLVSGELPTAHALHRRTKQEIVLKPVLDCEAGLVI